MVLPGILILSTTTLAEQCIIGNAICRNSLGFDSYCLPSERHCQGTGGNSIKCTCGVFLAPIDIYTDVDNANAPGFPFIGDNYPNITIIGDPSTTTSPSQLSTLPPTTTTTASPVFDVISTLQFLGSSTVTTNAPTTIAGGQFINSNVTYKPTNTVRHVNKKKLLL